jgi:hypothetical protein
MLPHPPNPDVPGAMIEVISSEPVTPHNRALYEAGKTILTESLKTGREFCQFMTTTSLAAVPVYLGLLTFASEHGDRQSGAQVWLVIPPCSSSYPRWLLRSASSPARSPFR